MSNGPSTRLPFFHHASGFGVSGNITRPVQNTIPTQAAAVLPSTGGHHSVTINDFSFSKMLSFRSAHVEVGGSFDEQHDTNTTYACSVIEDLNIMDVVRVHRVVSRLTMYSQAQHPPEDPNAPSAEPSEISFSVSGSYFENLRIAGHLLDIKLNAEVSKSQDTFKNFETLYNNDRAENWLLGGGVNKKKLDDLQKSRELEHNFSLVNHICNHHLRWTTSKKSSRHNFWSSAIGITDLNESLRDTKELTSLGGMICVPRFGVVFLGELMISRHHRHFNMIRVEMCSPGSGSITTGGTTGGGTAPG
jgi:hypothetical protein